MVSFWPWKGDDASPASFEKTLSALATKIANTQAQLDRTRATSRRVRVLGTLYLTFGYLVYAIVLVLVVGWKKMGTSEWSGAVAGPVVIYGTRRILAAYYNFRIDSLSSKLKEQQTARAQTIQKLKDATKYDSTQKLLEKYGGAEAKPGKGKGGQAPGGENDAQGGKRTRGGGAAAGDPSTPNRTLLPPPPTANIPRGGVQTPSSKQGTPRAGGGAGAGDTSVLSGAGSPSAATDLDVSAEFAPNAFGPDAVSSSPRVAGGQYAPAAAAPDGALGESHWYDRILDLLLGDDETAAKNRIVLICSTCRLVNGQAPPGTRSLAEVGSWRCMSCWALNGEAAEAKKTVSEVLGQTQAADSDASSNADGDADSEDGGGDVISVKEEEELLATGTDVASAGTKGIRKRSKKAK